MLLVSLFCLNCQYIRGLCGQIHVFQNTPSDELLDHISWCHWSLVYSYRTCIQLSMLIVLCEPEHTSLMPIHSSIWKTSRAWGCFLHDLYLFLTFLDMIFWLFGVHWKCGILGVVIFWNTKPVWQAFMYLLLVYSFLRIPVIYVIWPGLHDL